MRQTYSNILIALLMLIFIGQSSVSIAMSCSMKMSQEQAHFVDENTVNHEFMLHDMDHSNMQPMSNSDSGHLMSADKQPDDMNMSNCCLDQCSCATGSCNAYKVSSDLVVDVIQTNADKVISYPMRLPQSNFLSYLFKPPIQA